MSEVGLRAQSRVLSPSYIYRYIDSLQQFDYKIAPREQLGPGHEWRATERCQP
jgi:hypothetical protein